MSAWLQQAALWTWQNSFAAAALAAVIIGMRRLFRAKIAPLWLCLAGWLVLVRLWLPAPFPHAWAWDRAWAASPSPALKGTDDWIKAPVLVIPEAGPSVTELREELATAKVLLNRMHEDGIGKRHPGGVAASLDIEAKEQVLAAMPDTPANATSPPIDWLTIATWVWLTGAVCWFGHTLVRHRRFVRRLTRSAKPLDFPWPDIVAECAATAGLRKVPPLFTVPGSGTPFLCGLFRPRIILPAETLEVLTADEARHVLLHEMLHIRRRDLAANWLLAAARALHWFNPLVHFTCRRLLADRELLRDHQAIALLRDPSERAAYGHTLLKLALPLSAPAPSPGLAPLFRSEKELKRRLTMIQSPLHQHRLAAALATVALTVLSAALFTTARGQAAAGAPATPVDTQSPGDPPAKTPGASVGLTPAPAPARVPNAGSVPAVPATPPVAAPPPIAGLPAVPPTPAVPGLENATPPGAVEPPPPTPAPAGATSSAASSEVDSSSASSSLHSSGGPEKTTPRAASRTPSVRAAIGVPAKVIDARPAVDSLRSVAEKLRAVGRIAEADAIEEALKHFPAAAKAGRDAFSSLFPSQPNDMQQLRAEMAEIRAALASLKGAPAAPAKALEDQYDDLLDELKAALTSGFGHGHPKVRALIQSAQAVKERMEAKAKAAADAAKDKSVAAARDLEMLAKRVAETAEDAARAKSDAANDLGLLSKKAAAAAQLDAARAKEEEMKRHLELLKNPEGAKRLEDEVKHLKEKLKADADELAKARRAEAVKATDQAADNLPWGVAVPGKKGLVYSPYTEERSVVDVSGFEKRSKVKCPYTGNFFRVP